MEDKLTVDDPHVKLNPVNFIGYKFLRSSELLHYHEKCSVLVYQIRIYTSHDDILQVCTKIYRNNSGSLIPDSRISDFQSSTSNFNVISGAFDRIRNHSGPLVLAPRTEFYFKYIHCHCS